MVIGFFKEMKYASNVRNLLASTVGDREAGRIFDLDWVIASMGEYSKSGVAPELAERFILCRLKYEPKNAIEDHYRKALNEHLARFQLGISSINPELYWRLVAVAIASKDPKLTANWFADFLLQVTNLNEGDEYALQSLTQNFIGSVEEILGEREFVSTQQDGIGDKELLLLKRKHRELKPHELASIAHKFIGWQNFNVEMMKLGGDDDADEDDYDEDSDDDDDDFEIEIEAEDDIRKAFAFGAIIAMLDAASISQEKSAAELFIKNFIAKINGSIDINPKQEMDAMEEASKTYASAMKSGFDLMQEFLMKGEIDERRNTLWDAMMAEQ